MLIGPKALEEIWSRWDLLKPKSLSDLSMDSTTWTQTWTPDGPKMYTNTHQREYNTPDRLPSRLRMDHSSTPKSTSKALSDPFPDPTIHKLSGRVGS